MNRSGKSAIGDSYRDLLILEELSKDGKVTQRDVSQRLGIALGLVNSYIKNLTSKGYITVSTIPRKRYTYYLTPKGLIKKSRLAYQHLHNFTNLYNIARKDFRSLFQRLQGEDVKKIVFCGVDEIAEIAYLTLQEFDMELVAVIDSAKSGESFFEIEVVPIEELKEKVYEKVIITSYLERESLQSELLIAGILSEKIIMNGEFPPRFTTCDSRILK